MSTPTPSQATDPLAESVDGIVAVLARTLPSGYLTSLVRTLVPAALSAVLTWAALHWHVLPGHPSPMLVEIADLAVFALLYAGARWLEGRKGNGLPARLARGAARIVLSLGLPTAKPEYPPVAGRT
jgi:hypothetical protein